MKLHNHFYFRPLVQRLHPRWMVVMMGSNGALEASRTSSSMSSMAASPAHTARDPAASAVSAAAAVPGQHHIKATSSERMNNYMSEDDNLDVPLFVTDPTINNKGQEISEKNCGVLKYSNTPTFFPDFCPRGLKWVK